MKIQNYVGGLRSGLASLGELSVPSVPSVFSVVKEFLFFKQDLRPGLSLALALAFLPILEAGPRSVAVPTKGRAVPAPRPATLIENGAEHIRVFRGDYIEAVSAAELESLRRLHGGLVSPSLNQPPVVQAALDQPAQAHSTQAREFSPDYRRPEEKTPGTGAGAGRTGIVFPDGILEVAGALEEKPESRRGAPHAVPAPAPRPAALKPHVSSPSRGTARHGSPDADAGKQAASASSVMLPPGWPGTAVPEPQDAIPARRTQMPAPESGVQPRVEAARPAPETSGKPDITVFRSGVCKMNGHEYREPAELAKALKSSGLQPGLPLRLHCEGDAITPQAMEYINVLNQGGFPEVILVGE